MSTAPSPTAGTPLHATLADIARACGAGLPLPAQAAEGTVFAEPWQAHAFAMTVQLHARGMFTWPEWAEALSAQIAAARQAGEADDGSRYYHHWLNALETLVIARQAGSAAQIHALEHAWDQAAARTPHGQPIVLDEGELLRSL